MKNLNKKIGVVALAGMMALGGFVASGVRAQAIGGIPSIDKRPNVLDYQFVENACKKNGIDILVYSVDRNEINRYISKNLKKQEKRLEDIEKQFGNDDEDKKDFESYLEHKKKNSSKEVIRLKFNHYEYLLRLNRKPEKI